MRAFGGGRSLRLSGSRSRFPSSGFLLVAAGAALWGTDPLFRFGLAQHVAAVTIVLAEQTLPLPLIAGTVRRALARAVAEFSAGDWLSLVLVGAGASAVATLLFTQAFAFGSPTTPVLLQQLQPLFAISGARIVLGERLRPRYWVFLAAALSGAYLIAIADPAKLTLEGSLGGAMSVAAAALWGWGTVLGRRLLRILSFAELTGLRLVFGAIAAAAILAVTGISRAGAGLDGRGLLSLLALALIPGLFGLLVYYRGLRSTPAAAATLGEMAFPLTALLVGFVALHATLTGSQWVGVALLTGTIGALGLGRQPAVLTPTANRWQGEAATA